MKGSNSHYKKILKRKWPDPWYIRIDHRTPRRDQAIRIRYRVYPDRDSSDYTLYIAIFTPKGTLVSNDPVNKPEWKPENNAYRSMPPQYRRT